ncbi:MAG TPA: nicotinate-nicotinamide nucleotide adenylyltransferase [Gaiellaceae bacterium]|nr:nicotinate-nicotinamide nucleotide adenylyltransferase [Gaiellaceae bacterium]
MTVAVLGGVFDPPHLGHVALAEGARDQLGADHLLVLVAERPGHKGVVADAETRLRLAELALGRFGDVRLDAHPYTVDFLREAGLGRPYFVIGGDEWESFDTWKEPDEVRRLARIAVGERPGHPPPDDGVEVIRIARHPISSREIRMRVATGRPIDDLVPAEVAREIERLGLYRDALPSSGRGYTA